MATEGMKILVANLGSTSFKYRLFDMNGERQIARGGADRIGSRQSRCFVEIGDHRGESTTHLADHAAAVRQCLDQLTNPDHGCLTNASEVAGIGFKTVHGGRITGVRLIDEDVLLAMEEFRDVAPAHNPPYISAIRLLRERLPEIPLVAAFETGFHSTIPDRLRTYAIPRQWTNELQIKKWGFHGASHRYIAERTAELMGRDDLRIISCHLGGSSSLCAICDGKSVATTMGLSPQTGLPQNNRVGDFDPFALPLIIQRTEQTLDDILHVLSSESGLLGMSQVSGDIRDLEQAAGDGNDDAQLALDVYTTEIRRQLGGLLVELGDVDALVFTGGIGQHRASVRKAVCHKLEALGIQINPAANQDVDDEGEITGSESRTRVWVIPTNEELIVARQTYELLKSRN